MKRTLSVVAMLVLLAGCTEEPSTGTDPQELEPIILQVSGEPEETAVYQTMIEQYRQKFPGAEVELVEIPEKDDHLASLATGFAGGEPPDVFLINYREYAQFVVRGALEPVGDLLSERDVNLDDYYEQPIEAFTYEGALQCMPQNVSSLAVYYNTRIFKRAGIEPPHDGWTWEEFRDAAATIASGDVEGVAIDPQIIRLAPFAWSNGGEITDDPDSPTRFTLEDPATREALEFLVSLVRDDLVPSEKELASQDAESRFIKGELGMILSSRRDTPLFREAISLKWDVLPLPSADEPSGILHSDAYCISAQSDVIDSAADFVAWAMSKEGQTLAALSGRTVPSLKEVAASGAFLDPSRPPAHSEVFIDAIENIRNTPVLSTWPEIESVAEEILTKAFYEEGYTIDDAIRELDDRTRPLFEEAAQA